MHDNSELKVQNQDIDKNETIVPELWVYMFQTDQMTYD